VFRESLIQTAAHAVGGNSEFTGLWKVANQPTTSEGDDKEPYLCVKGFTRVSVDVKGRPGNSDVILWHRLFLENKR
jgi:hypothetical protein